MAVAEGVAAVVGAGGLVAAAAVAVAADAAAVVDEPVVGADGRPVAGAGAAVDTAEAAERPVAVAPLEEAASGQGLQPPVLVAEAQPVEPLQREGRKR